MVGCLIDSSIFEDAFVDCCCYKLACGALLKPFCFEATPGSAAITQTYNYLLIAVLHCDSRGNSNPDFFILVAQTEAVRILVGEDHRKEIIHSEFRDLHCKYGREKPFNVVGGLDEELNVDVW